MASNEMKEHLELVGVSASSRDSTVLKAILELKEAKIPTTFSAIKTHLDKILEKKLGKQWIYKCLASLEEDGFILIDRISSPKIYRTDTNLIKEVLDRKIAETKSKLESERKQLSDDIMSLENQDMQKITDYLLNLVRGSEILTSSKILEGITSIRKAILEMSAKASENDVFRISEKIQLQNMVGITSGPVEYMWMSATQKGAKAKILVEFSEDAKKDFTKDVAKSLGNTFSVALDGVKKGNIMIRTSTTERFPYKLIAINDEAMVIVLIGEIHVPNDGILLRKESNPALFNDILDRFDKIWDDAQDVISMLFKIQS